MDRHIGSACNLLNCKLLHTTHQLNELIKMSFIAQNKKAETFDKNQLEKKCKN